MSALRLPGSPREKTSRAPSGDHTIELCVMPGGVSRVSCVTCRVATLSTATSTAAALLAFIAKAICLESGDHCGPFSDTSGVLVRLTPSPVTGDTTNKSHCSLPPKSDANAIHFPSGDHDGCICRFELTVSWLGQPPSAGTSQTFILPEILVVNAIWLPSGDQVLPPIERDV